MKEAKLSASITSGERSRVIKRVTLVGAVANTLLSALKIVFGIIGNSQALVADGIHSLSDLMSDAMVYYAAHHSQHEPDEEHPYGHGRFETAATLGLALLLVLVAAGLIWDATQRLFAPDTLLHPSAIALYVAGLSVLMKEWLYHYTHREAKRIRSEMLRANAWHHRSDAISSIVVLVGVAGTMAGLPYLDAIAAVVVGVMIAKIGWELGWGSVMELVDTGLEADRIEAMRETILGVSGVVNIHMLRTRRIGGAASADVHVLVEPRISVSEGHMISMMVEHELKNQIEEIEDVTVHIDPEDDEVMPISEALPLRKQAMTLIDEAWRNIPGDAGTPRRLVFHYLSGVIDVDVYYPQANLKNADQAQLLRNALEAALADRPEFGMVRVYLQYAP